MQMCGWSCPCRHHRQAWLGSVWPSPVVARCAVGAAVCVLLYTAVYGGGQGHRTTLLQPLVHTIIQC
jgi:hypothetical protein